MVRFMESEWGPLRATAIACAVVGASLAVFGLVDVGGQQTQRAVTDGSFVVFSAFAAFTCFRAARRQAAGRRLCWWLLGGAATCYAVGNTIWFYYQVLSPETQTFPGPADVWFVLVVPFAVGAMLTLPRRALSPAARARAIADGAIVAGALLFTSWPLVVEPLLGQLGEVSWVYLAVYLYYPLSDIVIISIASGLAVRASGRERVPMLIVAAGFASIACADTGISYLALEGKEAAGSGFDLGWTFGYMLLGLAALTPSWKQSAEDRADPRALVREIVPYVPVGLVLVVAASNAPHVADGVQGGILLAIIVLLIVRHMLTLADNVRLTSHLEDLVRERTHQLEQLSRRHSSILDAAGEGIVQLDRSGSVSFANPAAAALLGYPADELVGASFHEITQPRTADGGPITADIDPVVEAMADQQTRGMVDATYRRADGTDLSVELTVAPIRGRDELTGAVVMFRDVTERRAIDRMKDEFVSVVSHELRTPLTSLRGALGLLEGGLLQDAEPKAQRMVHIAVESTDRLIRLINDILDIERIAAGKLTLHRQVLPAADLLDRAVEEMRGLALQNGVHLELGVAQGTVDADADRIVQTVANLVSNAIKFSPVAGTVKVTAAERGEHVVFSVSDEGVGIPVDQHEAIFGRFAQVDSSDTREQEGSGLGLAICRGIVEEHGGRIWVEGQPGAGATLCFTLPRVEAAAETATYVDSSAPTVLVCEDDEDTRAVISELLRAHGYSVMGAGSGEEAVALAAQRRPDAVLMDLNLPGMDGWSAISTLRSSEELAQVPVLIVSGTEPGSTPADVTDWLTKPLDLGRLVSAVDDAITNGATRPRVLVVEDDPALSQVLTLLFAEHGVKAMHASTARGALRMSRDVVPDLLLLDLLLPDSDGFALVDWLREDPRLCRVPLVVYSALELDERQKQRLRLGPTEFFTKTRTNPEQVERQVLELLDTVIVGALT